MKFVITLLALSFSVPAYAISPTEQELAERADETDVEQAEQDNRLVTVEADNAAQNTDIQSLDADVVNLDARVADLENAPSAGVSTVVVDADDVVIGNFDAGDDGMMVITDQGFAVWVQVHWRMQLQSSAGNRGVWFLSANCTGQAYLHTSTEQSSSFGRLYDIVELVRESGGSGHEAWGRDAGSRISATMQSRRGFGGECHVAQWAQYFGAARHLGNFNARAPFHLEVR